MLGATLDLRESGERQMLSSSAIQGPFASMGVSGGRISTWLPLITYNGPPESSLVAPCRPRSPRVCSPIRIHRDAVGCAAAYLPDSLEIFHVLGLVPPCCGPLFKFLDTATLCHEEDASSAVGRHGCHPPRQAGAELDLAGSLAAGRQARCRHAAVWVARCHHRSPYGHGGRARLARAHRSSDLLPEELPRREPKGVEPGLLRVGAALASDRARLYPRGDSQRTPTNNGERF